MLPPPGGGGHHQVDGSGKMERPNTLAGANKLTRRGVNICYHNEHMCKCIKSILEKRFSSH